MSGGLSQQGRVLSFVIRQSAPFNKRSRVSSDQAWPLTNENGVPFWKAKENKAS